MMWKKGLSQFRTSVYSIRFNKIIYNNKIVLYSLTFPPQTEITILIQAFLSKQQTPDSTEIYLNYIFTLY